MRINQPNLGSAKALSHQPGPKPLPNATARLQCSATRVLREATEWNSFPMRPTPAGSYGPRVDHTSVGWSEAG